YYGSVYATGTETGVELDLGADYVFSPNFQVGALLEFMGKTPATVTYTDVTYDDTVDQWNEYVLGGALASNVIFPVSNGINFIGHGEAGFYTLVGSAVDETSVYYSNGTYNLNSSEAGGAISAGLEFLMDKKKSWALDVELGYRFLSFSSVTVSTAGYPPHTLENTGGGDANINFSGPRLSATARLF
ncbi:MAG: hypothetical protein ACREL1_00440, partial [bacterium]